MVQGVVVDLSALVTFQDFDTSERSRLVARGGGTVLAGSLVDVRGVELVLDGTGTLPIAQLTSLTDGAVTLSGQDYAFPGLQNAAGTAFTISGVHADLSAVTNLTRGGVTLSGGGTADLSQARADRWGQLLGQRRGDAGPAGGAQLCARGHRQRSDADTAGLGGGQRARSVAAWPTSRVAETGTRMC